MKYYKGASRKRKYFEGWYFKHTSASASISFIPGINIDKAGTKHAFIQIITQNSSYNIIFPFDTFHAAKNVLNIQIEKNTFSSSGLKIDIETDELKCRGEINYGSFTPISYDIMGPFCIFPNMQCNHGIISLSHSLSGFLQINGELMSFDNGLGYIEKDWGSSFPERYLWVQCNDFNDKNLSIFASVAKIPIFKSHFTGCICVVYYHGKEYRFATYLSAKPLKWDFSGLKITQGDCSRV